MRYTPCITIERTMIMASNNDQVKTLIQLRKSLERNKTGSLSSNKAFQDFLRVQAEVTAEIDKTWATVQSVMLEHNITKIDGEWGYITMAERKSFAGSPAPRFLKKVLDTSKVAAYMKLHSKLPEGVTMNTTKYLSKRIKAV